MIGVFTTKCNPHAKHFSVFGCGKRRGVPGVEALPVADGLIGWYAARRLDLSNGNPVSTFTDLSGNGNHLTAAGSARPTFTSPGPQGGADPPALLFDGVNDLMSKTSPTVGSPTGFSIVMVYRTNAAGIFSLFTTAGPGVTTELRSDNRPRFFAATSNSIVSSRTYGASPPAHSHLVCARWQFSTSLDLHVFSEAFDEAQKIVFSSTTLGTFQVSGPLFVFNGYLYEFAIYNRKLSDAEKTTMEEYFYSKGYEVAYLFPAGDGPDAPSDLTAAPGIDGVRLAWRRNSTNETGFQVQQSFDGEAFADVTAMDDVDFPTSNPTEAEDVSCLIPLAALGGGQIEDMALYRFRIRAVNRYGQSAYVTVQVPAGLAALDPETGDTFIDPETGIPFVI